MDDEDVGEVRKIPPIDEILDLKKTADKKPMTQEEVENWILLKGQGKKRWFEIRILDKEVDKEPVMRALMEALSDMMQAGILGMPFMEGNRPEKSKVRKGVHMAIVDSKGKPLIRESAGSKVEGVVYCKDAPSEPAA